jgi:hypothetical protein
MGGWWAKRFFELIMVVSGFVEIFKWLILFLMIVFVLVAMHMFVAVIMVVMIMIIIRVTVPMTVTMTMVMMTPTTMQHLNHYKVTHKTKTRSYQHNQPVHRLWMSNSILCRIDEIQRQTPY